MLSFQARWFAFAVVGLCGVIGATRSGQAAITIGHVNDASLRNHNSALSVYGLTDNGLLVGSGGASGDLAAYNGALLFELPERGARSANLEFTLTSGSATTSGTNVDLWGLGYLTGTPAVDSAWFIAADLDTRTGNDLGTNIGSTAVTKIQDNILLGASNPGIGSRIETDASGDQALLAFIDSLYDHGASAGDHAVLRLNPDADPTVTYGRYDVGSANLGNDDAPVLTLVGDTLSVDIGQDASDAVLQPGWNEMLGPGGSSTVPLVASFDDTTLGGDDPVTVTVSGQEYFRNYAHVVTGGPYLEVTDVLREYALRVHAGSINLELEGLLPGPYEITTYHHSNTNDVPTKITLIDALGTRVIDDYVWSSGSAPTDASRTFTFFSDGATTIRVEFFRRETGDIRHSALNGFAVTRLPEPSTLLLLSLGIVGLFVPTRRRRRP